MFEIKNVSKNFGNDFALKNVSFQISGGLNFIIGASGSGKTTLLKILCGMEQDFSGEVLYNGTSVKTLSSNDKSKYYGRVFGFVWQDFNLLDDLSVFDNIKLPLYLNDKPSDELVIKTMKQLKIYELAGQKVKSLSGGQKQRVAIARELVKNPDVIIADEPTAALDPKSAAIIVDILKEIAKTKTVIIVTHDTSLIDKRSNVFELDKGELVSVNQKEVSVEPKKQSIAKQKLSLLHTFSIAITNMKSSIGRYSVLTLTILISATLLLVNFSGAIGNSGNKIFDELFATYGEGILDISLAHSFMSAAGGDEDQPKADVKQDLSGLYETYINDNRVQHIVFSQAFNNIIIGIDGKNIDVASSGNVPVFKTLVAGSMPMGNGYEVVVPESFVKNQGLSNDDAIGKNITFTGTIYNWDSGEPIAMPVNLDVKIVGIADTTAIYEYNGMVNKYSIDDSFFFSKTALDEMRAQAGVNNNNVNFTIRTNTPEDLISVKDELTKNGIVPLGQFELIEDLVRMNSLTKDQSDSTVIIISLLALLSLSAICVVTAIMRKKEYAIYKISGYGKSHLARIVAMEITLTCAFTIALFLIASPLINQFTSDFFHADILNPTALGLGLILILLNSLLCTGLTAQISRNVKVSKCLKSEVR